MTFEEMCTIEPKLVALVDQARWIRDHGGPGENPLVARRLHQKLEWLAGWCADARELQHPECYDVAYRAVYDAMMGN